MIDRSGGSPEFLNIFSHLRCCISVNTFPLYFWSLHLTKSSFRVILFQNVPMPKSVEHAMAWSNSRSGASHAGKSSLLLSPRPSPLQCPACPVVPRALLPVALVPCLALPCPALSLGFVQAVVWLVPHQCLIAWPHCLYGWLFFFLPLPPENVELFIEGVFVSIPLELCRISHSSPIPAPRHVLAGQKICSCKYFFQRHSWIILVLVSCFDV